MQLSEWQAMQRGLCLRQSMLARTRSSYALAMPYDPRVVRTRMGREMLQFPKKAVTGARETVSGTARTDDVSTCFPSIAGAICRECAGSTRNTVRRRLLESRSPSPQAKYAVNLLVQTRTREEQCRDTTHLIGKD